MRTDTLPHVVCQQQTWPWSNVTHSQARLYPVPFKYSMDGMYMHRNKEPKKTLRYLNPLYIGDGQYIITSFPPKTQIFQ
jgi:hypothetical protein